MKHILPWLFLFIFICPSTAFAAIGFNLSNFRKTNDYYSVDAEITGAATGSSYFIQAMFVKPEQIGNFGYTWSQKGEWFQYISSPGEEFIKSNFPVLETGQLKTFLLKPDTESSKYTGPGEYILKLKRYTGASNGSAGESNYLTVSLTDSSPTPENTSTPTPTTQPTATLTSTPTNTPTPTPTKAPTATKTPSPTPSFQQKQESNQSTSSATKSGQVLSDSTSSVIPTGVEESPSITKSPEKIKSKSNSFYKNSFIIGILISSIAGALLYFRLRNR